MDENHNKLRVVQLPDKNELKASNEIIQRAMPDIAEHVKIMAKIRYAAFIAHIEAGFSEDQALLLCEHVLDIPEGLL